MKPHTQTVARPTFMLLIACAVAATLAACLVLAAGTDAAYAAGKPAKVTNVKAASKNYKAIKVSWKKVSGAKKYVVYRSAKKGGTYNKVGTSTSTSFKDTGRTTGTTYYYKVRAYRTVSGTAVNGKVSAAVSAYANGYLDVTEAYELLNELRTTESIWYWNADNSAKVYFNADGCTTLSELACNNALESTAQTRAKELATLFSHTRPDGTDCITAFPDNIWTGGENIAAGYSSCASVINGWAETNCSYSGQGHRRNMLSSSFTSVGIACYVSKGCKYWAMDLAAFEDGD